MSKTPFANHTAFITGASSGIGAAVARELASQGARVVLAARRVDRLHSLCAEIEAAGGEALAVECDVRDRVSLNAAVAAAVQRWGGLDLVLANAGFGVAGSVFQLETEDFRRQFETNFFGVLDTFYATLPYLERSRGRFGVVSSVSGRLGTPRTAAYTASKFAVTGFCESAYYDARVRGISVTGIYPGFVASEIRNVDNQGIYTPGDDPVPEFVVLPAETAAGAIVRALYRRRAEAVITGHGKALAFMARHFPRLMRAILRRTGNGRT